MIKLEPHKFLTKDTHSPNKIIEKSPLEILQQRKIIFSTENGNIQQNFLIKKEEDQEIIYIKKEIPDVILTDFTKIAIQEDFPDIQALEYLFRASKLLEYYTQNQIQVQYTSVLFQKINFALILKKFNAPDDAISLLLDSQQILKIKGKTLKQGTFDTIMLAKIIQNKLLRLRILFQVTLLFSETRRNKQALETAHNLLKVLQSILQNTITLCQQMNIAQNINKKQRANSEVSSPLTKQQSQQFITQNNTQQQLNYPQIVEIIFKEILIIIKSILPQQDINNKIGISGSQNQLIRNFQHRSQSLFCTDQIINNCQNLQQNKLYNTIDETHPMLQMQILGLMQMTYVDLEELYPINSSEMVMAEEVILELIMLTGLSFYSISTELRFINNQQNKLTIEVWLGKAIEIFYTYVPHQSAIFSQIYQVYSKLYGVDKQSIPEDEEVEYLTKLLKPHAFNNKATLGNKIVIIIKIPLPKEQKQEDEKRKSISGPNGFKLNQGSLTAKKQIINPHKHLITQPNLEKFQTLEDEQQQQLFIKKFSGQQQQQIDIKQRVELLMNQIINQQAKLTQEKLKQKQNPITTLKQKYQLITKTPEDQKMISITTSQQFKTTAQPSRSLSNSRKTSQVKLKQQFSGAKTSQLRYRTSIQTLPGEETSAQKIIAKQISTQISSLNRNNTNKYFLLKRSDSAKKSKFKK